MAAPHIIDQVAETYAVEFQGVALIKRTNI
jgi:hypothetical protein